MIANEYKMVNGFKTNIILLSKHSGHKFVITESMLDLEGLNNEKLNCRESCRIISKLGDIMTISNRFLQFERINLQQVKISYVGNL